MADDPAVPDELLRSLEKLGRIHDGEAILAAAGKLFTRRIGRPAQDDLGMALPWLKEEADAWLRGEDLRRRRTNRKIARELAGFPGQQSFEATLDRVRRKLAKHRIDAAILLALHELIQHAPLSEMSQKIEEAHELAPGLQWILEIITRSVEQALLQHRAIIGEPDPAASLVEIVEATGQAVGRGIGANVLARQKIEAFRRLGPPEADWEENARN